jgi:hypothetical protein
MGKVRGHTVLRDEQTRLATFLVVPDLDMAGTRRLPCRLWRRSKHGRATPFTDSRATTSNTASPTPQGWAGPTATRKSAKPPRPLPAWWSTRLFDIGVCSTDR